MDTGDQNKLKLFPIGSIVNFGNKLATVIGIQIRAKNYIMYEIVWWFDQERFTEWVEESEISDNKTNGNVVGSLHITYQDTEQEDEVFGFRK